MGALLNCGVGTETVAPDEPIDHNAPRVRTPSPTERVGIFSRCASPVSPRRASRGSPSSASPAASASASTSPAQFLERCISPQSTAARDRARSIELANCALRVDVRELYRALLHNQETLRESDVSRLGSPFAGSKGSRRLSDVTAPAWLGVDLKDIARGNLVLDRDAGAWASPRSLVFTPLRGATEGRRSTGWTCLHVLAATAHTRGTLLTIALVRRLLDAGGNINARTSDGTTPLHVATATCALFTWATSESSARSPRMKKKNTRRGAANDVLPTIEVKLSLFLIKHGASLNAVDRHHQTCEQVCERYGGPLAVAKLRQGIGELEMQRWDVNDDGGHSSMLIKDHDLDSDDSSGSRD